LITDAVVSQVTTDINTGLATGVRYLHRLTREVHELRSKITILCAQALESTRVLLNSAARQFPNGLANSSGALGHYLMDHFMGYGASGEMPMIREKPWAGPPRRPNCIYGIRFRNVTDRHPDFIRGYGYQGFSTSNFGYGSKGFGRQFKEAVRNGQAGIFLGTYGECLARWDNHCELDREVVDAWGIPALRISTSYGENEFKMGRDSSVAAAEMLESAGARNITLLNSMDRFGAAIHEVGTARMGTDPKKSVLNKYCQANDIKNLFVMDGSAWVSSGCQNPTLTMMAIVCHSCAYLIEGFRRGELS